MAPKKPTPLDRFERLFGSERLGDKIAAVFRVGQSTAYRWLDGGFPDYTLIAIDLLEACARPRWPANAREALGLRDSRRAG
jgi:hypothetical protein